LGILSKYRTTGKYCVSGRTTGKYCVSGYSSYTLSTHSSMIPTISATTNTIAAASKFVNNNPYPMPRIPDLKKLTAVCAVILISY
jgi:hypothetical protein